MRFEYDLHGALRIRSNIDLGMNYFKKPVASADLVVNFVNDFTVNLDGAYQLGELYHGAESKDWVYYEQLMRGMKLKVLLRDVLGEGKSTEIRANRIFHVTYAQWIRLLSIVWNTIRLKLLQRGQALVHSACLSNSGTGVLLAAYSNTGKTLTALLSTRKREWEFLSDDTTLLDAKSRAYCFPTDFTVESLRRAGIYMEVPRRKKVKVLFNRTLGHIPLLSVHLFPEQVLFDAQEIFQSAIKTSTDVSLVVFLQSGPEGCYQISHERALMKLQAINLTEFGYCPEILLAYSYFNPSLNLQKMDQIELKIASNVLRKADCYVLNARDPSRFSQLLPGLVNKAL
jgi:hypothetical protein